MLKKINFKNGEIKFANLIDCTTKMSSYNRKVSIFGNIRCSLHFLMYMDGFSRRGKLFQIYFVLCM